MIDYKTAAAYIRVSTDDSDESKLVDIYRSVTEQGQQEMMAHADYIGERYKKNPSASADKAM